jgi:EmrB/QacA subfamily drug resistance transporter
MLLVDVTIVTVALPSMASGLHTSMPDLQWVLDLYALVLASLVLTAGSIADRFGRRAVYLGGLAVFAAASLTCGLSGSAGLLIAARGVQGLGAAAMFATTMALIASSYAGRDRGIAFGVWAAVNGAASAAGPVIGGVLTTHFGWRSIFFVNLPVSLIAVALTLMAVRESRDHRPRRVDLAGMVSFTAAAAALTYALIRGSWGSGLTLGLFAVAVAALVAFVAVERVRRDPMLDLSLLRNPTFTTLLFAVALLPAAAWSILAYQSLWLQTVLGMSPIEAGLLFLPMSLTTFGVSIAIGRVLHSAKPRLLIGSGLLLIAAGALAQAVIRTGSGWEVEVPGLFLVGLGAGLVLAPLSATAMAAVPGPRAGMAAGAVSTFRQLGYAFGVAVLGAVFRGGLERTAGQRLAGQLSGGHAGAVSATGTGMAHLVHQAFANGLDLSFAVAAGFGLIAGIAVLALVRAGRQAPAQDPVKPHPGKQHPGEPHPGEPHPGKQQAPAGLQPTASSRGDLHVRNSLAHTRRPGLGRRPPGVEPGRGPASSRGRRPARAAAGPAAGHRHDRDDPGQRSQPPAHGPGAADRQCQPRAAACQRARHGDRHARPPGRARRDRAARLGRTAPPRRRDEARQGGQRRPGRHRRQLPSVRRGTGPLPAGPVGARRQRGRRADRHAALGRQADVPQPRRHQPRSGQLLDPAGLRPAPPDQVGGRP